MKTQIFHQTKNIIFQKILYKKPKASLQDIIIIIIIIIITHVSLQAKNIIFQKKLKLELLFMT
jgi:hypothetical protein